MIENTMTLSTYFEHFDWFTVPLNGELKRLDDGKKTIPVFSKNWREVYSNNRNELDMELGGVITGKVSNIIAIDCDNTKTFEVFRALDPQYEFYFNSVGKGGGTIVYQYDPDISDLRVHGDTLSLDILSDKGFIYLPTKVNLTKDYPYYSKYNKHPELIRMPDIVKSILLSYVQLKKSAPIEAKEREGFVSHLRCEAIVSTAVKTKEYDPTFFALLTPKKYQDHNYTRAKGRHPNSIADGEGSNYLQAIATKLASDPSISTGLFVDAIQYINGLWDSPMDYSRLNLTIIQPHITNANGFWAYDPSWKDSIATFTSLSNDLIEVFVDADKGLYYIINHSNGIIHPIKEQASALEQLRKYLGVSAVKDILNASPRISVEFDPTKPFGHFDNTKFNLFEPTQAIEILQDPSIWEKDYVEPRAFISYINHFIPDSFTRNYLLRFLLTKLVTFNYSPVAPYLIGVQGSGKDTLITILRNIVGNTRVASIGGQEFIDKWNGFMQGTIFVQVTEMSKSISKSNRPQALSKFKHYTGAPIISIETKGINATQTKQYATLILTDNDDPLDLEAGDRRALYIHTPNTFISNPSLEFEYNNDTSKFYNDIVNDTYNICYYLATNFTQLPPSHYVKAPLTDNKHIAIEHGLPYAQRIVYMLKVGRFEELANFLFTKGSVSVDSIFNDVHKGMGIWESNLVKCYLEIRPDSSPAIMVEALRSSDLSKAYTTRDKVQNQYYYDLPKVDSYNHIPRYDIQPLNLTESLTEEIDLG